MVPRLPLTPSTFFDGAGASLDEAGVDDACLHRGEVNDLIAEEVPAVRGVQSPFGVEKGDAGAAQIALLAAVLVVGVHDDSDDLAAGVGVPGHAEGLSGVDAEHQPVGRRGRVGRKPEGVGKGVVHLGQCDDLPCGCAQDGGCPSRVVRSSERGLGKFVCSCGAFAVTTVTRVTDY